MRVVVITGSTSGIGLACARHMTQAGWTVLGVGLPNTGHEKQQWESLALDLTTAEAPISIVNTVMKRYGALHGLVNAAGINLPAPLEGLPLAQFERQMAVNVTAPLRLIQACLPLLRGQQGRIVNLSSLMGEVALPALGAYSMSKHALEAMSDTLRLELCPWQISVSLVQMGAVATPMTDHMTEALDQATASLTPELQKLYAGLLGGMRRALVKQAKSAIAPQRVADAVHHALTAAQPRPRYRVDAASKGLSLMRRLAPEAIGDWILKRSLGLD